MATCQRLMASCTTRTTAPASPSCSSMVFGWRAGSSPHGVDPAVPAGLDLRISAALW